MINAQLFGIKHGLLPEIHMLTYREPYSDIQALVKIGEAVLNDPYNDWVCILIKTDEETFCVPKYNIIQHDPLSP